MHKKAVVKNEILRKNGNSEKPPLPMKDALQKRRDLFEKADTPMTLIHTDDIQ